MNLGSVAGALNIGGVVGQLAGGVNVGGGSTNGGSTTTYAQRVISIPPKASYDLSAMYIFGIENTEIIPGLTYSVDLMQSKYLSCLRMSYQKGVLKNGSHYNYTTDNSPVNISAIVAYSFSENCAGERVMSANLYLKDVIGVKYNKWTLKTKGEMTFAAKSLWFTAKAKDSKDGGFQFPQ